ncbi:hypothetical protein [Corynebacterium lizhenjunii]|uniref:hypothetical protein n=1 Tax=Corynebacterium lizhenjunii TaxID=2709394 RepID=UPI0013ED80E4|nr:hypothetical protein [Corynebacterium lizhenjunii]
MSAAWMWEGQWLCDSAGRQVAQYHEQVLNFGGGHVLVERDTDEGSLTIRGTTSLGEVFTLRQAGFSVHHLHAQCGLRAYRLPRTRRFGRERVILDAHGTELARTHPRGAGLELSGTGPLTLDLVFLSWCAWQVDNPQRIQRM